MMSLFYRCLRATRHYAGHCSAAVLPMLFLCCVFIPASAFAQAAPKVGAFEADTQFGNISAEQMQVVRSKKILLLSRSFGFSTLSGLSNLGSDGLSYSRSTAWQMDNGEVTVSPGVMQGLKDKQVLHFLITYWPFTQRLSETQAFLRFFERPDIKQAYGIQIDAVMMHFGDMSPNLFGQYRDVMDGLAAKYPHIKIIRITPQLCPPGPYDNYNATGCDFGEQSLETYEGKAPLMDFIDILSTKQDGVTSCGCAMCPEFNRGDQQHPNVPFIQTRMAKALIVMMQKLFADENGCDSTLAPSTPTGLAVENTTENSAVLSWNAATHPENCAVTGYRVRRDNDLVGSPTVTAFTDTGLVSDRTYAYTIAAVAENDTVSEWSPAVTATTTGDTVPPSITDVPDTDNPTRVVVRFSEALETASAQTAANYRIDNGITVTAAVLQSPDTVVLTSATLQSELDYTLSVSNVRDASPRHNPIAADSSVTFRYQPGSADHQVVRRILNANNHQDVRVQAVTRWQDDRVVSLILDEMSITTLPAAIGGLNRLQTLSISGNPVLPTSLLTTLPAELADCSHLTELRLANNRLADLPERLAALTGLTRLELDGNRLCALSDALVQWANRFAPGWRDRQQCGQTPVVNLINRNTYRRHTGRLQLDTTIDNLWDGNTGEDWDDMVLTNTEPLEVEFDFGDLYNIQNLRLFGDGGGDFQCLTYSVKVKPIADSPWITLVDAAGCNSAQWFDHAFDAPTAARYLLLEIAGRQTDTEVREFQVFGSPTTGDVNHAPEFNAINDLNVRVGHPIDFTLSAMDADDDALIFSASGLPTGAQFEPHTGRFRWTPTSNDIGAYRLSFIVTDDGTPPLTDTLPLTITVTTNPAENTAPSTPGGLSAQFVEAARAVHLSWESSTDAQNNLAGYRVYRRDLGNTPLSTVTQTTCPDNNVQFNTTYTYEVIAFDSAGLESPPARLQVHTPDDGTVVDDVSDGLGCFITTLQSAPHTPGREK